MARSFNAANSTSSTDKVASGYNPGTASHTVSMWLNVQTTSPSGSPLDIIGFTGGATRGWRLYEDAFQRVVKLDMPGVNTITLFTPTLGTWYNVVITYTSGGTGWNGYVGGSSQATQAGSINGFSNPLAVGTNGGNNTADFLMADVAAWNVVLTAAEITALSNGARPGSIRSQSLVNWLPLGGLQSPEPDLSGNANNGTLTGTTNAFGPPLMQFTPRWAQFSQVVAAPTFSPAWARSRNTIIEGVAT